MQGILLHQQFIHNIKKKYHIRVSSNTSGELIEHLVLVKTQPFP